MWPLSSEKENIRCDIQEIVEGQKLYCSWYSSFGASFGYQQSVIASNAVPCT